MAEDAAHELPNLPLEDALQLVHLYAERGSPKYEKAALRWLGRYLTESSPRLRRFAEVSADSSRSGWEALPTLRALFDCVAQVCPTRNTPSVPTRRVAMSTTTSAMGTFYDEQLAASQLRKYREKGPIPSTQGLIEALKAEGIEGMTLLDIGGGIGAIQHELLDAGVTRATSVDASAPYLDAARQEGASRGHERRVTYMHGDFVDLADTIPPADIVTVDRVLNVYPEWERLAGLAAAHAQRFLGLVYPRDTLMTKLVVSAMNLKLRLQSKTVRAAIRPGAAIERIARENGLMPHVAQDIGPAWHVAVFRRT